MALKSNQDDLTIARKRKIVTKCIKFQGLFPKLNLMSETIWLKYRLTK